MNTQEMTLNLQAYVDGELDAVQRAELEKYLTKDADARTLVTGLQQLSTLLKAGEPVAKVPDTREFYWSQIQRRIKAQEKRQPQSTEPARRAIQWLRWLVPSLGVAAAAVVTAMAATAAAPVDTLLFARLALLVILFSSHPSCPLLPWDPATILPFRPGSSPCPSVGALLGASWHTADLATQQLLLA
jgi:anti-sigma factor RsiW